MPMLSKFERMKYSKKYDSIDGELKILNKGNGFVINELSDEKFFIKNNFLKGAMNGDRVRASINTSRYGPFLMCRVEKIIKRKSKFFTAKIYKYKKHEKININLYMTIIMPLYRLLLTLLEDAKNKET